MPAALSLRPLAGRIQLDTNEGNAAARALYESLGFSAWAETPGGNNLLMRRRL
jgi:RimJ/RimL family protein N-acetyltransferase